MAPKHPDHVNRGNKGTRLTSENLHIRSGLPVSLDQDQKLALKIEIMETSRKPPRAKVI